MPFDFRTDGKVSLQLFTVKVKAEGFGGGISVCLTARTLRNVSTVEYKGYRVPGDSNGHRNAPVRFTSRKKLLYFPYSSFTELTQCS